MNPQNIEPHEFKEGQSGNPNGRPVGSKNRSTIARKVLAMRGILPKDDLEKLQTMFPDISKEMTMEEIITIVQAGKAAAKDTYAYQALMDSAYGRPSQPIEHSGELVNLPLPEISNEKLEDAINRLEQGTTTKDTQEGESAP